MPAIHRSNLHKEFYYYSYSNSNRASPQQSIRNIIAKKKQINHNTNNTLILIEYETQRD